MSAASGYVVAVIGKFFPGTQIRQLPNHPITLDHNYFLRFILMNQPFPTLDTNPLGLMIPDIDEVDERMRTVLRVIQTRHVDDVIDLHAEAIQLFKGNVHRPAA